MAEYARKLIAGNPSLGERISVSLLTSLKLLASFFLPAILTYLTISLYIGNQGQT